MNKNQETHGACWHKMTSRQFSQIIDDPLIGIKGVMITNI